MKQFKKSQRNNSLKAILLLVSSLIVCVSVCGSVHVSAGSHGGQKRALDLLELV